MSENTARNCLVAIVIALGVQLSVRSAMPSVDAPMRLGVIRPPPDCGIALYEECAKIDGEVVHCGLRTRFTCEDGAPTYRRIYRDPLKE